MRAAARTRAITSAGFSGSTIRSAAPRAQRRHRGVERHVARLHQHDGDAERVGIALQALERRPPVLGAQAGLHDRDGRRLAPAGRERPRGRVGLEDLVPGLLERLPQAPPDAGVDMGDENSHR